MISSTNIYYDHVHNSSYNYNYRFPMKRTHEDTIESHKRRKEEQHMHVYVERKKHHQDNYDSLLNLKKPNLDIEGPLQTSSYGQSKPGMYNIYITIYTLHC